MLTQEALQLPAPVQAWEWAGCAAAAQTTTWMGALAQGGSHGLALLASGGCRLTLEHTRHQLQWAVEAVPASAALTAAAEECTSPVTGTWGRRRCGHRQRRPQR